MQLCKYYKSTKEKGGKQMRENKFKKFVAFALLITVIAIILIASTYAKYTKEAAGDDTAIVAKWGVGTDLTSGTFDIFDVSKIYDTKGVTDYTQDGTADSDVKTGTTHGIIAPGTWGKFSYELSNESQVSATYEVDYTVDEDGVYLLWSTDGTTWTDDLADIPATTIPVGTTDEQIDIYWKWSFEADSTAAGQSDANDTALGEADTLAQPTIDIKVTFTQVD